MSEQLPSDPVATPKSISQIIGYIDHNGIKIAVVAVDFACEQERRIAELTESLAAVLKLHSFSHLDKGIGTATPEGRTLLRARELVQS